MTTQELAFVLSGWVTFDPEGVGLLPAKDVFEVYEEGSPLPWISIDGTGFPLNELP